jgi:hypothetical protein
LQIPFHHKRNVEKLQDYIFESKVDGLACVGDEIDVPQLGAFNKGTRAEFERTLQRDFNTAHNVLADFREALDQRRSHLSYNDQIIVNALKNTFTRMHQPLNLLQRYALKIFWD